MTLKKMLTLELDTQKTFVRPIFGKLSKGADRDLVQHHRFDVTANPLICRFWLNNI